MPLNNKIPTDTFLACISSHEDMDWILPVLYSLHMNYKQKILLVFLNSELYENMKLQPILRDAINTISPNPLLIKQLNDSATVLNDFMPAIVFLSHDFPIESFACLQENFPKAITILFSSRIIDQVSEITSPSYLINSLIKSQRPYYLLVQSDKEQSAIAQHLDGESIKVLGHPAYDEQWIKIIHRQFKKNQKNLQDLCQKPSLTVALIPERTRPEHFCSWLHSIFAETKHSEDINWLINIPTNQHHQLFKQIGLPENICYFPLSCLPVQLASSADLVITQNKSDAIMVTACNKPCILYENEALDGSDSICEEPNTNSVEDTPLYLRVTTQENLCARIQEFEHPDDLPPVWCNIQESFRDTFYSKQPVMNAIRFLMSITKSLREGKSAPIVNYQDIDALGISHQVLCDEFHKRFYTSESKHSGPGKEYFGIPIHKNPLDMFNYQQIICETKPDYIIECGGYQGGSTLFFAHTLDLLEKGKIISIDTCDRGDHWRQQVRDHHRCILIKGSSTSPETIAQVRSIIPEGSKVFIILDSLHTKAHVLRELQLYSDFLQIGNYIIAEDSNINGHPLPPDWHGMSMTAGGPYEAVEEFLQQDNRLEVDEEIEHRFLFSYATRGYLVRTR